MKTKKYKVKSKNSEGSILFIKYYVNGLSALLKSINSILFSDKELPVIHPDPAILKRTWKLF